jgi:hypothetical protein
MDKKKILVDAILESARKEQNAVGKLQLTCARAFALARKFDVKIIEIGRLCNQNNIKICKCQLGCFK